MKMVKPYEDIGRVSEKAVFASEAKNTKALHTTLITTYGMERKAYFSTVQSEVTMDDLFAS